MILDASFENQARGVRLDAAILLAFPSSTRAFVKEAVASGEVLVDGRRAPKGLKLHGGETVKVARLAEASDNTVRPAGRCPRPVYEDADLLAFDKPAGMPVQPLSHVETGTLMNAVVTRYPECVPLGDRPLMAGAIHRIDADTSGLVLVARTAAAFECVRAQFAAQTVEKTYLAMVEGSVAAGGVLEHDLIHDPTLPFCRMIDARRDRHSPIAGRLADSAAAARVRPLHAVTRFRPLAHVTVENEERTLLEVKIFTGVTHQIRAQLALAGMHIVNDRLYGAFAVEDQTGHSLHSLAAKFLRPGTGEPIEIRTPLPPWAEELMSLRA